MGLRIEEMVWGGENRILWWKEDTQTLELKLTFMRIVHRYLLILNILKTRTAQNRTNAVFF